ncbi:hypothetical protein [Aurantiacibacter luteus]|uniref:Gene transfer agent protein n=1 Tax=Aurantiacibacter luteus TaxID=1581420 RepID=A0A0G9MP09_9SPHN|nr:hypothetical protein [Aurantiacibacter luteus]KLE32457.1 hypothetical protein AAW00_13610 [Aurantiacibacter luteus]
MSNSAKGRIDVELEGGPTLTFQLDFAARVAVEDELGRSFAEAAQRAGQGWQGDMLVIMWAGLQRHHGMTKESVMELLDEHGPQLTAAMERAAHAAAPDAKGMEGNGSKAASRPASKSSGRSGARQG